MIKTRLLLLAVAAGLSAPEFAVAQSSLYNRNPYDVFVAKGSWHEGVMSLTGGDSAPDEVHSEGWIRIPGNSGVKLHFSHLYVVAKRDNGQVVPIVPPGNQGNMRTYYFKNFPENFKQGFYSNNNLNANIQNKGGIAKQFYPHARYYNANTKVHEIIGPNITSNQELYLIGLHNSTGEEFHFEFKWDNAAEWRRITFRPNDYRVMKNAVGGNPQLRFDESSAGGIQERIVNLASFRVMVSSNRLPKWSDARSYTFVKRSNLYALQDYTGPDLALTPAPADPNNSTAAGRFTVDMQPRGEVAYNITFNAGSAARVNITGQGTSDVDVLVMNGNQIVGQDTGNTDSGAVVFTPTATKIYKVILRNFGQVTNRVVVNHNGVVGLGTVVGTISGGPNNNNVVVPPNPNIGVPNNPAPGPMALNFNRTLSVGPSGESSATVNLAAGQKVRVTMSGQGKSDVDIFIHDPTGKIVASDLGGTDRATVNFTAGPAGTYRFRLKNLGNKANVITLSAQ